MLEQYLEQLNSPDAAKRREAVIWIGRNGDPRALKHLAVVFKNDPDPAIRELAGKAGHALEVIAQAIEKAGYKMGEDIFIALDVASSEFFDKAKSKYVFKKSDKSERTAAELVAYYAELKKNFPIISIEDGCAENDWDGWAILTRELGGSTQLVGDDLFVTNTKFLQKGIDQGIANSILVKVNQIGSLTETLDAVELAHRHGYTAVMSHRSGETEDYTIADLAVATNCGQPS